MQFIACSANLRARNYQIHELGISEIRQIAGKIQPAIGTTTAAVAGLICLELYKLLNNNNSNQQLSKYRHSYLNLALPLITMCEPIACATNEYVIMKLGQQMRFSMWDKIEIRPDYINDARFENGFCLKHMIEYFDQEWSMDLNMLMYGRATIYAFYMNARKLMIRKKMPLKDLVPIVSKKQLPNGCKMINFEVNVEYSNNDNDNADADDEDPYMPTICLYLQ
jgi:ubiquitin-activating enzyme E1